MFLSLSDCIPVSGLSECFAEGEMLKSGAFTDNNQTNGVMGRAVCPGISISLGDSPELYSDSFCIDETLLVL